MKQAMKTIWLVVLLGLLPVLNVNAQNQPVETQPPETQYSSAFDAQTRAPSMVTKTELILTIINEDLEKPWGMAQLPDGRLIITQKDGSLVIVNLENGVVSQAITGILSVDPQGQGGLLDIALAPDFDSSRLIYVTFSQAVDGGNVTAVGRGQLSQDEHSIENFEVIFQATPAYQGSQHYGSRLVFDDAGHLLITTGERSDPSIRDQAQSLDSYLGKVLYITTEGTTVEGHQSPIFTFGHRNVQGLAISPETGEIWISEMGPRGGDELNLLMTGQNYGWPEVSYGIEYSGQAIKDGQTSGEDYTDPVYYWDPVIAPSGMAFYDQDIIDEWQGNLFIGALAGQHIARLLIQDQTVVSEERLLEGEGERFRDVLIGTDGALYAITDSGKLYQVKKK